MRPSIGPARTCPEKRQRNAQKDIKTQRPLAGISYPESKELLQNLVGFHVLLMKYDCNELGSELPQVRKSFPTANLSHIRRKVKP